MRSCLWPLTNTAWPDDAPNHRAYFSQSTVLYRDRQRRAGGWPMETPNPNARNTDTASKLVDMSYRLVGLDQPAPSP